MATEILEFSQPNRETFFEFPSHFGNGDEHKLLLGISDICLLDIEDVETLLEFGLLECEHADETVQGRLSKLFFNLMGVTKNYSYASHCYKYLLKRSWFPSLIDTIGVLMSWGATPKSLGIHPLSAPVSYQLVVAKLDVLPIELQVEQVMDFIINPTQLDNNELICLIKILIYCSLDKKIAYRRGQIVEGIKNCLNTFDNSVWVPSFFRDLCTGFRLEQENLINAIYVCCKILPKTKEGNRLSVYLAFHLLKCKSKEFHKLQKVIVGTNSKNEDTTVLEFNDESEDGVAALLSLLRNCGMLWNMKLNYVYYVVLLIQNVINRQETEINLESLQHLTQFVEMGRMVVQEFHQETGNDIICLVDLISTITTHWDMLTNRIAL